MGLFSNILGDTIGGFIDSINPIQWAVDGVTNQVNNNRAKDRAADQYYHQLDLQHDAQAYNTAERQASQQFLNDMWNKNNAYNAPSSQVNRLRQAGLNPISATMQSSQAQQIGSSPQASSSAGSASQAQVLPLELSSATLAETRKTNAEALGVEIDNRTRQMRNLLDLEDMKARIRNSDMDTKEKERKIGLIDAEEEKIWNDIGIGWANVDIGERQAGAAEKNAESSARQAGAAERQAGAAERQAGAAEKNAETNRINAITAKFVAQTERMNAWTNRMRQAVEERVANANIRLTQREEQQAARATEKINREINLLSQQYEIGKITKDEANVRYKKLLSDFDYWYNKENWWNPVSEALIRTSELLPFTGSVSSYK